MWFNYDHGNSSDFTKQRLCKISNEIQKSSLDYYLIIQTETVTEAPSLCYKQKPRGKL